MKLKNKFKFIESKREEIKTKMEIKRFNVKFKGGQLDRTIHEETKEKAEEYFKKKFPKRKILSIEEY
jgi:hypothetical protein